MSWPLASFTLIAAVLAIGWLAYERSRPSARTAALVATLSALAALGRDAFAALDDVKPITAMTFVVGYSLGPIPGFVVGAIGMLASNIVLGQGSWTPWQMAAWGIVGLLGALAGKLTRRRLPRLPLALGCAFAALVAKEIMNLYVWSIGASHTSAALLAAVGQGLPFDVVDVVSTLLFGLAFGPELARLLARSRARMQVDWHAAGTGFAAVLALLLGGAALDPGSARAASASATATSPAALERGVQYLLAAQKADGGFGQQAGAPSTELFTGWSAIALAAAGRSPLGVHKDGHNVLDALQAGAGTLSGSGAIERTILALHACGLPAATLDGHDLSRQLASYRKPDGSIDDEANHTAFAILAMRSLGDRPADPAIQAAARWLAAQQNAEGGFSFGTRGDPSDIDDTGTAIQALAAAGAPTKGTIARAVSYLRRAENRDGGFPQQSGEESNAASTAWAVQGLVAARQPLAFKGRSPIAYLESLLAANGSFNYSSGVTQTPVWVTAEVLPALAGLALPIAVPAAPAPPRGRNSGTTTPGRSTGSADVVAHAALSIAMHCEQGLSGLLAG
ncbi:MAG: prenyltransferase/squalene oxidase repeat-containing protein [Solirubrobacteraceae bacterium]